MVEKLIKEYVDRMTLEDVNAFSLKNGIVLNNDELLLIFRQIKNHWHTLVYGNPRGLLDDLRGHVDLLTYQKIENLYINFKEKFKNYL